MRTQKITRWIVLFSFSIVLLLSILPLNAVAATSPDIQYVEVNGTSVSAGGTIDVFLNLGETFRFKINVENNGDDSPRLFNNITLCFSQFQSSSDKSRVWIYDISGDFEHTGSGTSSSTKITDRRIYGTSQFSVTVNDIVEHHHNIMRVREEHTGDFEMDREVTVTRYGGPNEEP